MSQTTLTSFFASKKRPASEDIVDLKSKVPHVDSNPEIGVKTNRKKLLVKVPDTRKDDKQTVQEVKEQKNIPDKVAVDSVSKEHFEKPIETAAFSRKLTVTNIVKPSDSSKYETASTARKELSLGEIRKRLAGSSRLAEIKASAERISKGIQLLKEASEKKNLKEFKSIDLEVHSRSVS